MRSTFYPVPESRKFQYEGEEYHWWLIYIDAKVERGWANGGSDGRKGILMGGNVSQATTVW